MTSSSSIPKALLLLSLLTLIPACGAEAIFEDQSAESISITVDPKDGHHTTRQRKISYHPILSYQDGEPRNMVVRETLTSVHVWEAEGVQGNLKADLFRPDAKGKYLKSPSHTIEIPNVQEAKFHEDRWEALTHGCCDAETYGRLYTYGSDSPFLRYNQDYWRVTVPNSPLQRYVGFVIRAHVPNEEAEKVIFGDKKEAVACISYAAPGKPLASIYLKPKSGVDWSQQGLHTEKLEVVPAASRDQVRTGERLVEMWSLDGAEPANKSKNQVSGLQISASVYLNDGTTEALTVDLVEDKFANPGLNGKLLEVLR